MALNSEVLFSDPAVSDVATILESKHIKRVPVVEDGRLVGIISRANLLQALATLPTPPPTSATISDRQIRQAFFEEMRRHKWASPAPTDANVTVKDGVVYLWGLIHSDSERQAMLVAARGIPGVKRVEDRTPTYPNF